MKIKYIVMSSCLIGLHHMAMAMVSNVPQQRKTASFYITQLEKFNESEASILLCCPCMPLQRNEKTNKILSDIFDSVYGDTARFDPVFSDTAREGKIKKEDLARLVKFKENHTGLKGLLSFKELVLTSLICSTCVASIAPSNPKLAEITACSYAGIYMSGLRLTACPVLEAYCEVVKRRPELVEM